MFSRVKKTTLGLYSATVRSNLASHHHRRVAGEGRCVAEALWPCRMARLQSSVGEMFESRRTLSIQRVRGRPGRRFQSRLGV